jgi:Zn-dependent protease
MLPTRHGSIHLFRVLGIDVYLHWSWFVIAMIEIASRRGAYSSVGWNVLEYLALFLIVLLHEGGHALACRSVGGKADEIVLWPFGGVAYVAPPMRPGPTLWSIAAGPLVNVILFLPLSVLAVVSGGNRVGVPLSDLAMFFQTVWLTNAILLGFNILPIYPLDGGQIVRSLLWFFVGRTRSLKMASVIGFIGVPLIFVMAWLTQSIWIGLLGLLIVSLCWRGLQQARYLARIDRLPRHTGFRCPSCRIAPPIGTWWPCAGCVRPFDAFATMGVCPHCGARFAGTRCLDCGEMHAMEEWRLTPPPL